MEHTPRAARAALHPKELSTAASVLRQWHHNRVRTIRGGINLSTGVIDALPYLGILGLLCLLSTQAIVFIRRARRPASYSEPLLDGLVPLAANVDATITQLRSRARIALARQGVAIALTAAFVLAMGTTALIVTGRMSWWPGLAFAGAAYLFYTTLAELFGALDLYARYRSARSRVLQESEAGPLSRPDART